MGPGLYTLRLIAIYLYASLSNLSLPCFSKFGCHRNISVGDVYILEDEEVVGEAIAAVVDAA